MFFATCGNNCCHGHTFSGFFFFGGGGGGLATLLMIYVQNLLTDFNQIVRISMSQQKGNVAD